MSTKLKCSEVNCCASASHDETISELNRRLGIWIHDHYGQHATKKIQNDLGLGKRSAEYALSGKVSATLFRKMLAHFGIPLVSAVFGVAPDIARRAREISTGHLKVIGTEEFFR